MPGEGDAAVVWGRLQEGFWRHIVKGLRHGDGEIRWYVRESRDFAWWCARSGLDVAATRAGLLDEPGEEAA